MKKSLSERIADRIIKKEKENQGTRAGKNRAEFLANKTDINMAIEDGWSLKIIHETLSNEGKISFGYDAFRKYVKQYTGESNKKGTQAKATTREGSDGFKYNPNPNKEELY